MSRSRHFYDDGDDIPSFGVPESKKKGDGMWCPDCRNEGVYTWLDFWWKTKTDEFYKMCPVHRMPAFRERKNFEQLR